MDGPACQGCRQRDARIAELEARSAELEARMRQQARLIAELARKLQDKDLPKSAERTPAAKDPTQAAPQTRKQSRRRKPGGQPGHPPYLRQLVPPERVSKTVPFVPSRCRRCDHPLPAPSGPNDPAPTRFKSRSCPRSAPTSPNTRGMRARARAAVR